MIWYLWQLTIGTPQNIVKELKICDEEAEGGCFRVTVFALISAPGALETCHLIFLGSGPKVLVVINVL